VGVALRETRLLVLERTVSCHHLTEEAAQAHARMLRSEGFDAKLEPDGDRWLVKAHRDDSEDDGYTVERFDAVRGDEAARRTLRA
jgi:hypothetical protein